MMLNYNPNNREEILNYAKKLIGINLKSIITDSKYYQQSAGKGRFGQTLEEAYFGYSNNNISEPDFLNAGLELKSSPIIRPKKGDIYKAKERLVLGIIDYHKVAQELNFNTSHFYFKNKELLLVFYEYLKEESYLEHVIRIVDLWEFPETDRIIIKQDWELIQNFILTGQAHLLSESLTNYLAASTKGANKFTLRTQPNSDIKAMQRAFSLKVGYVNQILESLILKSASDDITLVNPNNIEILKGFGLFNIIQKSVKDYIGLSTGEIITRLNIQINPLAKGFINNLSLTILNYKSLELPHEIKKSSIIIRSIILKKNGIPKEAISFPSFDFIKICNQTWHESELFELLDSMKFIFFIYEFHGNDSDNLYFKGIKEWHMPYEDIEECRNIWESTKALIMSGNITKALPNGNITTNFTKISDNKPLHVRPHAKNADDTRELPTKDKITGKNKFTKQSFWLTPKYLTLQLNQEIKNQSIF
jgi:DNA mismatch repair protein MutH